jgi:CPA1 family monovalent cation:H+ antiporter
MHTFEVLLALLLGATILSSLAKRLGVPYPTLLALGGALLAFFRGAPDLQPPPQLILALFVAPVLLDAAYDASLRDLRANWRPVGSLVLVAVGLTTAAVACVARLIFPEMPWAAAIALGAVVAPPDAVAALAVLRQFDLPFRMRVILEGESLLNDASALLIYRLALGAVAAQSFNPAHVAPTFFLVAVGSVLAGWLLAWPIGWITRRVSDAPSAVILQFVFTFSVWLLAEQLGLSGVVTIVVLGLTLARRSAAALTARIRVPSFTIWETVTRVLNVLAFTLIGLQLGPILDAVSPFERKQLLLASLAVLAAVIALRLFWTFTYDGLLRLARLRAGPGSTDTRPSGRGALVVGWSGMRGIVTLATALALPIGFPYRDFIELSAFVVVLGTLLIQGLTLRPLLAWARLPRDDTVAAEVALARKSALEAALTDLDGNDTPEADRIRRDFEVALARVSDGRDPRPSTDSLLRGRLLTVSRGALDRLRRSGAIGDDAYRRVEEELDFLELTLPSEAQAR